MKKKVLIFILVFTMITVNVKAIDITKVNEINQEIRKGNIGEIDGNSYLEMDYRSINTFDKEIEKYKYYPRIKKVNNYYILTYHGYEEGGKNGSTIYYSLSTDLINWTDPQKLFRAFYREYKNQLDRVLFSNCDVLPLKDGKVLMYARYQSKHLYNYDPYSSGVVSKICSINNNQLECEEGTILDEYEYNSNSSILNKIGTYDIGTIIHIGPTWEPHVFYDNNSNIVMTFSSGEPINKKEGFKHSSGGVGTIVSKDGGKTWSEAKYSAYKFIGNYDIISEYDNNQQKNVNYYTTQMAVTTQLNDGRYFSVYEMWSPSDQFEIPDGYSISGSIYSNNYDYEKASNIKVSDVIEKSLTENPSTNDPRQQQSYSGDAKSFFNIVNPAAAPYILQFSSGEVVVSYNHSNKQYLKMITNLNNISDDSNTLQTFNHGYWGSIALNGNQSLITSFPYIDNKTISYATIYLNNTLMSNYSDNITIDGNNNDWKNIDDAVFVGSDSQAQSIIRFTHDDNKIYILVEELDRDLQDEDQITLKINSSDKIYNLILNKNNIKLFDENNNEIEVDSNKDIINSDNIDKNGIIYEISIDKSKMNIINSFKIYTLLENKDDNSEIIQDTILNTDIDNIDTWLKVKLLEKNIEPPQPEPTIEEENNQQDDNIIVENIDSVPNTLKNISIVVYLLVSVCMIASLIIIYRTYKKNNN